jgi:hypothetical protein
MALLNRFIRTTFGACVAVVSSALFCTALSTKPAAGARFPNAVGKSISLSGPAATEVAGLFGLSDEAAVSLPLGRGDAWAIYLLKRDTKVELLNDNDGSPPRQNVLSYSPRPMPSLSVAPFWLDLATRHPDPQPGSYSFSSPFLSDATVATDPWTALLARLQKDKSWHSGQGTPLKRCFDFPDKKQLCITVFGSKDYAANKDGYTITVSVRLP